MPSKNRFAIASLLIAGISLCVATPIAAQTRVDNVTFPRGKSQVTLLGTVKGNGSHDYVVMGTPGQMLNVSLTGSRSTYFNVLPPRSNGEAIFVGSNEGDSFSGRLDRLGRYTIRVYQMGAAADGGKTALYTVRVGLTGLGVSGGMGMGSGGGGGRPAVINDLRGMSDIRAIDVLAERGFQDVDSFEQGNGRYGIFWRPRSRQCVQVIFSNGRVQGADDIGTHEKCR